MMRNIFWGLIALALVAPTAASAGTKCQGRKVIERVNNLVPDWARGRSDLRRIVGAGGELQSVKAYRFQKRLGWTFKVGGGLLIAAGMKYSAPGLTVLGTLIAGSGTVATAHDVTLGEKPAVLYDALTRGIPLSSGGLRFLKWHFTRRQKQERDKIAAAEEGIASWSRRIGETSRFTDRFISGITPEQGVKMSRLALGDGKSQLEAINAKLAKVNAALSQQQ